MEFRIHLESPVCIYRGLERNVIRTLMKLKYANCKQKGMKQVTTKIQRILMSNLIFYYTNTNNDSFLPVNMKENIQHKSEKENRSRSADRCLEFV